MDMFESALKEKQNQEQTLTDVERKSCIKYMYAAVYPDDKGDAQIQRYSITSNTWENVQNFSRSYWADSALNCIDNCLYLIEQEPCGKFQYKMVSLTVYRQYNYEIFHMLLKITSIPLSTMHPRKMKSAIYNTCYFATATVGHYLYIIGGALEDCSDATARVQR